eukprot:COSAG06_NODE_2584_length_6617_cov_9.409021_6_plen_47_part_00
MEQPLVFGVQRCCVASVVGPALEMFQRVEKACAFVAEAEEVCIDER